MKKSVMSHRVRRFGRVFTFPLRQGPMTDFGGQCGCPWRAQRAIFLRDFGVLAPENPKFSLACRGMWVWALGLGSFLSPWWGSR